jgi:hypothetical protein
MLMGRPKGRTPAQMCIKGCGHRVGRGNGNEHSNCPPARGEHGAHRSRKRLAAKRRKKVMETTDVRGVAVIGVGGSKAKSYRRGTAKGLVATK